MKPLFGKVSASQEETPVLAELPDPDIDMSAAWDDPALLAEIDASQQQLMDHIDEPAKATEDIEKPNPQTAVDLSESNADRDTSTSRFANYFPMASKVMFIVVALLCVQWYDIDTHIIRTTHRCVYKSHHVHLARCRTVVDQVVRT